MGLFFRVEKVTSILQGPSSIYRSIYFLGVFAYVCYNG